MKKETAILEVNGTNLPIKELNNQRVVTFKDIDKVHKRPEGTASRNFRNNKEYFIEGEDYFILKPIDIQNDEIRRIGIKADISNRGTMFITESGYLMIVKSLTDKKSWEVQRKLVKSYFKLNEVSYALSEELPVDMEAMYKTVQDLNNKLQMVFRQMDSMESAFDNQYIEFKNIMEGIQTLFNDKNKNKGITTTKISKLEINKLTSPREIIQPLAKLYGDNSVGYNGTYRKVYRSMDVSWNNRQTRYKNKKGNKTKPSKFKLLESDKKLLRMFGDTVDKLIKEHHRLHQ